MSNVNWLKNPGPHKLGVKGWLGIVVAAFIFVTLWFAAESTYSEQPKSVEPAAITATEGIQATVRANNFNSNTGALGLQVRLNAVGDLVDSRGMLTQDIEFRVVDDNGVSVIRESAGDPLGAEEVVLEADGDVTKYPFDTYKGSFSLLAEKVAADGTVTPLALSVGTSHAETGWFTTYKVTPGANDEAKITIVSMHREPFAIAFAIILAVLLLLLGAIAVAVGFLTITNRRASDPGIIGWLVGVLFAMPFTRRIMPGDPPIGCALDVQIFSWALILCTIAIVLAMVAWLRQSRASHEA